LGEHDPPLPGISARHISSVQSRQFSIGPWLPPKVWHHGPSVARPSVAAPSNGMPSLASDTLTDATEIVDGIVTAGAAWAQMEVQTQTW
jgi:hypothetical protein